MIKICFVCLGNICRSPMAEFIFRFMLEKNNLQDKISVVSKATSTEEVGNPIYFRAVEVLKRHQIPYRDRQATVLLRKDYDTFDYIIGMDSSNIFHINRICGDDSENKVFKLLNFCNSDNDIEDPWYTGNFDKVYEQIYEGCSALLKLLKNEYKL